MKAVVFSVDAELAWGFHDFAEPPSERLGAARWGWNCLLELFDKYRAPATWAVVGHLLLDRCGACRNYSPGEDEHSRCKCDEWDVPRSLVFGDGLITELLNTDVDHDVGCHTFSHTICDEQQVTRETVREDVDAAIEVGKTRGIEYDSFIFPRNVVGHRDVLSEFGFTTYRGGRPRSSGIRRPLGKLAAVADPERVPLSEPTVDEFGLVNVPPSLFLFGFEGLSRNVIESAWMDPVVRQARCGIDRAIRENKLFHMWLHPNNIRSDRDVERIRSILEHVDRRRRETELTVETMADVAARHRQPEPKVQTSTAE